MTITRRKLLKTCALAPMLPVLTSPLVRGLISNPPPPKQVFILLHGMFFLEFDTANQKLIVAAPQHNGHWHYVRRHGQNNLTYLAGNPNIDVTPGNMTAFSLHMQMLRFPKSAVGVGQQSLVLKASNPYQCRMEWPYPNSILTLREGPSSAFLPDMSGNVAKKLLIGDSGKMATVTCLVYTPGTSGPYVESYYAEHPTMPTCTEINDALTSANKLCGGGFDLQLKKCSSLTACTERDDELPDGVSKDDEWSLQELHGKHPCEHPAITHKEGPRLGGDVSSCPQFGII